MSCDKIKTMLNDYLDGDLSGDPKRSVDTHLDQCAHCRGEFEGLKEADDLLSFEVKQMFKEIPVPGSLLEGIERELARERKMPPFFRRVLPYTLHAGAAAVLFVLIAAAGLFWSHFVPLGEMGQQSSVGTPQVAETNAPGDRGAAGPLKDQEPTGPAPGTGDALSKPDAGGPPRSENQPAQTPPAAGSLIVHDKGTAPAGDKIGKPEEIQQKTTAVPQEPAAKKDVQPANDEDAFGPPAGAGAGVPTAPRAMSGGAPKDLTDLRAAGSPSLKRGSMEQAVRETGFAPILPSYMPGGASLVHVTWQDGAIYTHYRVSGLEITVGQRRAPSAPASAAVSEGRPVEINGVKGVLAENPPGEGCAESGGGSAVYWESGGWAFSVQGGLPPAELVRIANSIQ